MQVEIKIDSSCIDPKVIILTASVTENVNNIVKKLSEDVSQIILGYKKGEISIANNLKISYIPQDTLHLKGKLNDYIQSQGVDETLCKTILRKLGFSRELFNMEM